MKTIEKIQRYKDALRAFKRSLDLVTAGLTEPEARDFGLTSTPEKHLARTAREEIWK